MVKVKLSGLDINYIMVKVELSGLDKLIIVSWWFEPSQPQRITSGLN